VAERCFFQAGAYFLQLTVWLAAPAFIFAAHTHSFPNIKNRFANYTHAYKYLEGSLLSLQQPHGNSFTIFLLTCKIIVFFALNINKFIN